eukprot:8417149-Alexandrium_andersonii.AAC.1
MQCFTARPNQTALSLSSPTAIKGSQKDSGSAPNRASHSEEIWDATKQTNATSLGFALVDSSFDMSHRCKWFAGPLDTSATCTSLQKSGHDTQAMVVDVHFVSSAMYAPYSSSSS